MARQKRASLRRRQPAASSGKRSTRLSKHRSRRTSSHSSARKPVPRAFRAAEFIRQYVHGPEQWKAVAAQYKEVHIVTMNSAYAEVREICRTLMGRLPTSVIARSGLHRIMYSPEMQCILKSIVSKHLHVLKDLDEYMLRTMCAKIIAAKSCRYQGTGRVYFTDDSFTKEAVESVAQILYPMDDDWLYFQHVPQPPEYDLEHVQKIPCYDTWCIDFDGTITTDFDMTVRDREYEKRLCASRPTSSSAQTLDPLPPPGQCEGSSSS